MQTGPVFSPALILGQLWAMMLTRKVRLWLDFRGKWMALGAGGSEEPGCLQRALGWNPAQCSMKSTSSR